MAPSRWFAGGRVPLTLIGSGYSPYFVSGSTPQSAAVTVNARHYVATTVFVFLNLLLFMYWMAFPYGNAQFIAGFPQFAVSPPPQMYQSSRYSWTEWWPLFIDTFNLVPPLFLQLALLNNSVSDFGDVHSILAHLSVFANLFPIVMMSYNYIFTCMNTPYSSVCNSVFIDCVQFANPVWAGWTQTTVPCVPNKTSAQVSVTTEWVILYVFSWMWLIVSYLHTIVNAKLRQRGVWYEVVGAMYAYAPSDQDVASGDSAGGDDDEGGGKQCTGT